MVPSLDMRDRTILETLHRNGEADVQQLCDVLGVTRTAIRQRISRLESSGLLESGVQSQRRGRPRNIYQVTAKGLHSLGEDYRELAVVLWKTIAGIDDSAIRQQLFSEVRDRLADRFRRRLTDTESIDVRLDELAGEMKSSGFNVESDHSTSLPILRETNCPFPLLADVDEAICQVERQVLEQVLGAPVRFKHRCRDGHHCCEFEVQTEAV
ncbi:MAG: MarR family transcriptional regulator [Planctomycetaceae bacterium]